MGSRSKRPARKAILAADVAKKHFGRVRLDSIVSASRSFPLTARVDVQRALDSLFGDQGNYNAQLLGIHSQYVHQTLSFAQILSDIHYPTQIAPLQLQEVDIGEEVPARCLVNGLWLGTAGSISFAFLMTP